MQQLPTSSFVYSSLLKVALGIISIFNAAKNWLEIMFFPVNLTEVIVIVLIPVTSRGERGTGTKSSQTSYSHSPLTKSVNVNDNVKELQNMGAVTHMSDFILYFSLLLDPVVTMNQTLSL